MKPTHAAIKITTSVGKVCLLTACFASILISAEKTYSPKSGDETEILYLVLKAEFLANNWSSSTARLEPAQFSRVDEKL